MALIPDSVPSVPPNRILSLKGMTFQSGVFAWHPRRDLLALGRRLADLSGGLGDYREEENCCEVQFDDQMEVPIVRCLAWNDEGSQLAVGGSDCLVRIWNTDEPQKVKMTLPQCSEPRKNAISSLAWSPTGDLLLASVDSKTVVWHVGGDVGGGQGGRLVRESEPHTGSVADMAWRSSTMFASCCASDRAIHVHQLGSAEVEAGDGDNCGTGGGAGGSSGVGPKMPEHKLVAHTAGVTSIQWCPQNELLASGSHDTSVRVWSLSTCSPVQVLEGHQRAVRAVAWCPDNSRLLASGSSDGVVRVWDAERGVCRHELAGHSRGIYSIAVSPDGRWLASVGEDKAVAIWSLTEGKLAFVHREQQFPMLNVRWHSRSGSMLLAADNRFELAVFDIPAMR